MRLPPSCFLEMTSTPYGKLTPRFSMNQFRQILAEWVATNGRRNLRHGGLLFSQMVPDPQFPDPKLSTTTSRTWLSHNLGSGLLLQQSINWVRPLSQAHLLPPYPTHLPMSAPHPPPAQTIQQRWPHPPIQQHLPTQLHLLPSSRRTPFLRPSSRPTSFPGQWALEELLLLQDCLPFLVQTEDTFPASAKRFGEILFLLHSLQPGGQPTPLS